LRTDAPQVFVEASAPCALELGPGVALALDRRVSCRVEASATGFELELKDARFRQAALELNEFETGPAASVAQVLARVGVPAGRRVAVAARVPGDSGLAVEAAIACCVAAAALGGAAPGEVIGHERIAAAAGGPPTASWASLLGGVVAGSRRLRVDPARIEELLLLLDPGALALPAPHAFAPVPPALLERALLAGDLAALVPLWSAWAAAPPEGSPPGLVTAVAAIEAASGRAFLCRERQGGLLAAWIPPPERRRLTEVARQAGLRPVATRLDLLGLDRSSG